MTDRGAAHVHTALMSYVRVLAIALFLGGNAPAQHVLPTNGIDWPVLGTVQPRAAAAIASSPWSIGGETLDRGFAVYDSYKAYLGPLGAKAIRLQAGWARCELQQGVYSWDWLDAIVNDAHRQGLRPWLQFSYGNPLYSGGGGPGLGGPLPTSPEALAAWDRWVIALVQRYGDRVKEWEIWNEPDLRDSSQARLDSYIELYIRTAAITRELQPDAQLYALGLAHSVDFAARFLTEMKRRGKLGLVDAITVHGYPRNPDDTTRCDEIRDLVKLHDPRIQVRQGETGAPSKYQERFALSKIVWTETSQAKWNLRRMLAHYAKGIPFNLFTISDLHYVQDDAGPGAGGNAQLRMNYKGLLATNPDKSVAYAKPAYSAAQTVFALFDGQVQRIPVYPFSSSFLRRVALTAYRHEAHGEAQLVAVWFNDAPPDEALHVTRADLSLPYARFTEPVLVDVRTSTVYAIPKTMLVARRDGLTFRSLPLYDSPVLIAEKSVVPIASGDR